MGRVWVSRSARKHRQSRVHILAAMQAAGDPEVVDGRLHYVGVDDRGVKLHIVAVPDPRTEGDLLVVHAMPTDWRSR